MRYRINHRTQYRYHEPVTLGHTLLVLAARNTPWQQRERFHLRIQPNPGALDEMDDWFGNHGHYFEVQKPHDQLVINAHSVVQTYPRPMPFPEETPPWEKVVVDFLKDRQPDQRLDRLFLLNSPMAMPFPALQDYAAFSFPKGRPLLAAVMDLTRRINTDFAYTPGSTTISTPLSEVLERRVGVCQDFAHFEIACLRAMGIPARYVSGYLETLPPPGQTKLMGVDASHAWIAVKVPELGWVDVDPTNDMFCGERHVTVAWGRDYNDVPPLRGMVIGGSPSFLEVSVDVIPVASDDLDPFILENT